MYLKEFPDETTFNRMASQYNVIPLCMEILCDTETPITLLSKFCRLKTPIFLFESVTGGEKWGRYSFMGISNRSRIRIFSDRIQVEENGRIHKYNHQGDPLGYLKAFTRQFKPAPVFESTRFWCGMVGYLNYEMVSFFEKIPNRMDPEVELSQFIVPDALIIFDNVRKTISILILYFVTPGRHASADYRLLRKRLSDLCETALNPSPEIEANRSDTGHTLMPTLKREVFLEKVRRVKSYIRAGDVIQTVISHPFICENPPDPLKLYRALRYVNPSPYLFYLDMGETMLIGSSPETMVRLEHGKAFLRPIAGTRQRGIDEEEDIAMAKDLLKDEKERAEHIMLVDLGRNDLGRVAETGSVHVTQLLHVERYSHVMHLVSDICCNLSPGTDAWDLLRSVFPAGTLTGAPKVRAMEIINEMEQSSRGPYGGAVGYISFSGNMDLAITIRTAQIEKGRLVLQSGAGIVADSDPEKEWTETVNKAEAMNQALKLIR